METRVKSFTKDWVINNLSNQPFKVSYNKVVSHNRNTGEKVIKKVSFTAVPKGIRMFDPFTLLLEFDGCCMWWITPKSKVTYLKTESIELAEEQ